MQEKFGFNLNLIFLNTHRIHNLIAITAVSPLNTWRKKKTTPWQPPEGPTPTSRRDAESHEILHSHCENTLGMCHMQGLYYSEIHTMRGWVGGSMRL